MKRFGIPTKYIVLILSIILVGFHLYTAAFGTVITQLQRSIHLTLAAVLGFLCYPRSKDSGTDLFDILLAVIAGLCFGYILINYDRIALRQSLVSYLSPVDLVIGAGVILLVIELTRRTVGKVLSLVTIACLLFAYYGQVMPDIIAHIGVSLRDIIDYQAFGLDGVYSMPLSISATYIVLFIILGTIMEYSKAGDVIMDLGKLLAGRFRGGPAKVACLTSAFFGSISGSAAANVYATGTFTIPMMKRIGYKPATAGAVEAIASTGGQIMPPVMGAAAFIMAETIGIPYISICKAALMPAVFYYISLILVLDFIAAKRNIKGIAREELPKVRDVLPKVYLLLPLIVLVVVLIKGYTPFRASFIAIILSFILSFFRKDTRFTFNTFLEAVMVSARRTSMIAIACAAAGIVIGTITQTGVGLALSSIIVSLSGGHLWLALILIMISCIIMGMGTPTTVAYIIVATLAVPIMKDLNFADLPSHLFVFYFGVMSMITPPVAIAAYAAGEIAQEDPMKIGFAATKLAAIVYILPFVFLFDNSLLLIGEWPHVVMRLFFLLLAVCIFAGAITGWTLINLSLIMRALMVGVFCTLVIPDIPLNLLGTAAFGATIAFLYMKSKRADEKLKTINIHEGREEI